MKFQVRLKKSQENVFSGGGGLNFMTEGYSDGYLPQEFRKTEQSLFPLVDGRIPHSWMD
jgi:hypothetical protein